MAWRGSGTWMSGTDLASFGTLADIDVAANVNAGSDERHKVWTLRTETSRDAGSPLVLKLTVTKGSENKGCFFALSEITLGMEEETSPLPGPEGGKIYHIVWKNTESYMTEEADGSIVIADYDVARRCFWEFVATGRENCFYVRNTASGRYIGSCNMTPSSSSKVNTSVFPVEYYVGKTAAATGDIAGCHWFSSTDCDDYSDEASGPRALNKDGASDCVITWQAGTSRPGSYWTLVETEDLYEVRPFKPSAEVGKAEYEYDVLSVDGKALAMNGAGELSLEERAGTKEQSWYFVGTGNATGGYLIVNAASGRTVAAQGESDTRWVVMGSGEHVDAFVFRPAEAKGEETASLTVDDCRDFKFSLRRSDFSRAARIYEMPCGVQTTLYVAKASIGGEGAVRPLVYPLPVVKDASVDVPSAPKPSSWYTLYTSDKATVSQGSAFVLELELSEEPTDGQSVHVYFDWNRDGVFETSQLLPASRNTRETFRVPATAVVGKSRMRIRVTENGMAGADDEVAGQIVDFIVDVCEPVAQAFPVSVSSNDETRGAALLQGELTETTGTAVAIPKGNAAFLYWREGNRVVSVDATYRFVRDHVMDLVACFSPNTEQGQVGIGAGAYGRDVPVRISAGNSLIAVDAEARVRHILVFAMNGTLAAHSAGNTVSTDGIPPGPYLVQVLTDEKDVSVKVIVR